MNISPEHNPVPTQEPNNSHYVWIGVGLVVLLGALVLAHVFASLLQLSMVLA